MENTHDRPTVKFTRPVEQHDVPDRDFIHEPGSVPSKYLGHTSLLDIEVGTEPEDELQ